MLPTLSKKRIVRSMRIGKPLQIPPKSKTQGQGKKWISEKVGKSESRGMARHALTKSRHALVGAYGCTPKQNMSRFNLCFAQFGDCTTKKLR